MARVFLAGKEEWIMTKTKRMEFRLQAPGAQGVALAGTFNNWATQRTPLKQDKDGTWSVKVAVPPGHREHRFVVYGRWVSEPTAPVR
jgi:1,4-alpha-glucan branching enzyme